MTYALKTTGIPAAPGIAVKAMLMVNETGDAVIDLAGNSITPHAEVTIGTGSWNGTARKHFTTTGLGSTPKGVKWNSPFPDCNWDSSAGCSVYVALESINAGNGGESGRRWIRWENAGVTAGLDMRLEDGTTNQVELIRDSGSVAKANSGSRSSAKGSIALRANQSTAGSIRQAAHGSALADVTGSTTPGFLIAGTSKLKQFGGLDTAGWISTTVYCVLVVEGALSNAQLSALHTDWFAELVDAPVDTTAPNITSTGTGSTNGPFAANVAEESTAVCITLTADEDIGTPTKGGADASRFTVTKTGTRTITVAPSPAINFEALPHANPFVVTVDIPDLAGTPNVRTVTLNLTVTNVTELPGAPTIGTATAGDATVSIAFTPPAAGAAPTVSGYTATLTPGGATKTGSSSPIVFTSADGVANGTAYTGRVAATNSDGTGPQSAASNSVTPSASSTVYSALTDVIGESGIKLAAGTTLYWTWFPGGRPGAMATAVQGSGVVDSAGKITVSHTLAGAGLVIIGRRPGPTTPDDRLFAQFLTLA